MTAFIVVAALLLVTATIGLVVRRAWSSRVTEHRAAAARVADRDRALAAEIASLTDSRDRATAAAAAKAGFLAAMSHEIRTPMSGVVGMLGLLSETHLDDKQREFVRTATTSATALLTIIDDILDFSKIEAGKLALERIEFEVRSTIEDAAQLLSERASAKGIELTCLIHREVPEYLTGDPTRLRQVLLNLGANAIKFTATGAVRIQAHVDIERPAGVALRFEVTDSGIGMSEQAQQTLFEPFAQADVSTSRRYGGSGLGLSICRGLVELMGGRIGVSSSEGSGSTFWFTAELTRAAPRPEEAGPPAAGETRVLVIDPSEVNGEIYRSYLEPRGVILTLASHVEVARRRLDPGNPSPDLVLVDSVIPAAERIRLGQVLRGDPRLAGVRLALVEPLHHQREPADGEVFAGFLTKPIRRQALLGLIWPVAAPAAGSDVPSIRVPNGADRRQPRVLLADDNEINRLLVVEILARVGIATEVTCNGAEAVEARFKGDFDVVLMDCQMPVMDGLEATRAIRAREATDQRPPVPIIALTANASVGIREQCLAAGMSDYLPKPFTPAALVTGVARWGGWNSPGEGSQAARVPPRRSNPSPPADTPFDLVQFNDVVGTDPEEVRRFLTVYRHGTTVAVQGIESAVSSADGTEVQRLAHKLKGAAGMIGARRVSGVAGAIQRAAEDGVSAVGPLVDELRAAVSAADAFAAEQWGQGDTDQ